MSDDPREARRAVDRALIEIDELAAYNMVVRRINHLTLTELSAEIDRPLFYRTVDYANIFQAHRDFYDG